MPAYRDLIEKPNVHHAMHLATLRSAVEKDPLRIVKAYKSFAKAGHPWQAQSKQVESPVKRNSQKDSSSSDRGARSENIEFSSLDNMKDTAPATSNAEEETGGGGVFSVFARKRNYESGSH